MKLTKWKACLLKNNKQLCANIRDLVVNHIAKYLMKTRVDLKLVPIEAPENPQRILKTNTKAFAVDPMFRARNQYFLTRISRLQDQIDTICNSTNTSGVSYFDDTLACAHERARTSNTCFHGKMRKAPKKLRDNVERALYKASRWTTQKTKKR